MLEYLDRILPGMDRETADEAFKLFKQQGFDFQLGARVTSARVQGDRCVVERDGGEPITCDRVLVSGGRKPGTEGIGLETVGVVTDKRGFTQVDGLFATSAAGVFAIGDVIGGTMLAHKAEEEGIACVEHIVTGHGRVNYDAIPAHAGEGAGEQSPPRTSPHLAMSP